nr:hypothetical protein [Tanacetum cinerariifolium]
VVQIVLWYLDSVCSKHTTSDRSQLTNFVNKFLDLEVAFHQHTCFIRNLEGVDLLTGSRGNNLYTLSLGDMMASTHICLLSKALKTNSWLWHRRLSHLNFGAINHLARQGLVRGLPKLKFEKDHLCSACAMGKSASPSYPNNNGTEFVNQTLREYYEQVGISHETLVARSSHENLGKLQPNADIGIFIGYALIKKAFWIYNRRTRRIVETIHVDFDELTAMASEQSSSGPALHDMTPATITLEVIAPITDIIPPEQVESTGSPSSTTVDQDAPSPSKYQTTPETQPHVIPQDVEEDNHDIVVAHMENDPFFSMPIPEVASDQSSSTVSSHTIVHPDHQIPQHNSKWTKDHPLNNIIGQLSRPVSPRLQLHEQALFCYYDAFLTYVEPKTEEVYFSQPDGFVDQDNPNHVYKLEKVLYGLKQAPRAWYDMLSSFLLSQDFSKGLVDPTLFICRNGNDLLLKYNFESCDPVDTPMVEKSILDEDKEGKPLICQIIVARHTEKLLHAGKRIFRYLRGTVNRGLWYLKDSSIALTAFADADHAGCQDTRRSTSGSLQFLGDRLISWSSKRHKSDAISSMEAEYIALSKHIDIIYHFIKENVENGVIKLYFFNTEYQLADLFTKALGKDRIEFLINKLGMRSFTPETLKQLTNEVDEYTMDMTIDQQVALDEALVPHASRLTIGKRNFLLRSDITSKESTLQMVYDVQQLTPFYKTFLVTADETYCQSRVFWGDDAHMSKTPSKLTDVNINHGDHSQLLSISALVEKVQAMLVFDFVYQVEHKEAKKSNEMYYPMFTKVIIHNFMTKDPLIPRRNKVNWHYVRDAQMVTMIKLVSRHQNPQQFGVMLLVELTNEDIRNSEAYKEYYAVASGAAPPKTKASVRKTKSSSDTIITPPTVAGTRLSTSVKGKQPTKASKAKSTDEGTSIIPGVLDVPTEESDEEISWKSSDEDDDDDQDVDDQDDSDQDKGNDDDQDTDNEGKEFIHPKLSIHEEEETKDEESFDPIVQTPKNLDDEASTTMASLTLATPTLPPLTIPTSSQVQQAPTPPTTAPSTFLQDLPNFGSLFGFDHRLKTLEANFSEFMQTNQFAGSVSSILGIVQRYMD